VLTDHEIARRLPVWHAFSELFLDTELQPDDYSRIVDRLRSSGFERAELQRILEEEVAPAFIFNLLDVAGEWCSWSAEQVREIVLHSLSPRWSPPPVQWLRRQAYRRHTSEEWAKIEPLLGRD
jgi:hypothetical protein